VNVWVNSRKCDRGQENPLFEGKGGKEKEKGNKKGESKPLPSPSLL